jgi:hypothetical protein
LSNSTPQFPAPSRFGNRLRFDAFEVERFKRELAGLPAVERDPAAPIRFVHANDVCADLAIDRRTLGRRIEGRVLGDEPR